MHAKMDMYLSLEICSKLNIILGRLRFAYIFHFCLGKKCPEVLFSVPESQNAAAPEFSLDKTAATCSENVSEVVFELFCA